MIDSRSKAQAGQRVTGALDNPTDRPEALPGDWHQLEIDAIATFFSTSTTAGLSPEAAGAHLARYGPNELIEAVPRARLQIFLSQFVTLPVALLTAAAAISFLLTVKLMRQ